MLYAGIVPARSTTILSFLRGQESMLV